MRAGIVMGLAFAVQSTGAFAASAEAGPVGAGADDGARGRRQIQLTPQQLLASADSLVAAGHYDGAAPLLRALGMAPGFGMQTRFLQGLIASRTGDPVAAANHFKAILANDPRQTRVRLELGRAYLAMRKSASADRQFRIAEQDRDLPQEVARTIRTVRDTIRGSRTWRLDLNAGIAPDSNINNATSARSVTVLLGDEAVPVALDEEAQSRSGLGQVGLVSAGLRLPIADRISAIAEIDGVGTNYEGSNFDDYVAQGAVGAEYRLSDVLGLSEASLSLQGVAAQRWFGGDAVSRQYGVRIGGQTTGTAAGANRYGFQLDLRRMRALFDRSYDGWQTGLYGTFERAIGKTIIASASPFVRRDRLREEAFSNTEYGANIGVGGELRYGINFGVSVGASRAKYDAPLPIFDVRARRDNRYVARATLGNRKLRVLGLSPQLVWTYTKIDSSLRFYDSNRSRFEFTLARFF